MARIHYTDDTKDSRWLCLPDSLCHIHDPKMRKYLAVKNGYFDTDDDPADLVWVTDGQTRRD